MQLVTKANFDVQKYTKISEDKTNLHNKMVFIFIKISN
jgi:hypothetical protein